MTSVYKHIVHQWDYGARSLKPTWLFSNRPWISGMDRHKSLPRTMTREALVTKSVKADGQKSYCGNRNTKSSQHYPAAFGTAAAQIYRQHEDALKNEYKQLRERVDHFALGKNDDFLVQALSTPFPRGKEGWRDANLQAVFEYLSS